MEAGKVTFTGLWRVSASLSDLITAPF